jgi:poly(3-hydroxybutyrate) depolymerase
MRSTWVNAALAPTLVTTLVTSLGCSGAEDDADDVQTFQPGAGVAPGSGAPPASATPPGATPAPSDTSGITTPGPGAEAPPPVAGIDTGSGTPAANGGTQPPAPSAPAPAAPPADPDAPATPAASGATASAGCALAQGAPQNPTTIAEPNTIVTFPQGYDGTTPKPLVFAFHGAGRTNVDMRTIDSRTANGALESAFVMAYVKSAGNAWDPNTDHPRFSAVLDQLQAQFCIDTAHVFAFGHSSGAQFIVQILGSPSIREQRFAGVVEVASSRYDNPAWDPLPTLVIHGLNDNQRPGDNSGAVDIVQYVESNQCSGQTQPLNVPTCNSIADDSVVNPGCVEYSGCAAPTVFCNHNDPNYIDNGTPTNHGWPCFANAQIQTFFESLL